MLVRKSKNIYLKGYVKCKPFSYVQRCSWHIYSIYCWNIKEDQNSPIFCLNKEGKDDSPRIFRKTKNISRKATLSVDPSAISRGIHNLHVIYMCLIYCQHIRMENRTTIVQCLGRKTQNIG